MARSPETADDAFENVVSYAGASINPAANSQNGYNYASDDTRTKIDAQVLYETRTGTGLLTGGRDNAFADGYKNSRRPDAPADGLNVRLKNSVEQQLVRNPHAEQSDFRSYPPDGASEAVTLTASVTVGAFTIRRGFTVTVIGLSKKFDFGNGAVQGGYTAVTSSTTYSLMTRYGFTDGTHDAMTRAPGDIPSGMENLYNDQINGVSKFKADVPNGKYKVVIHYGSNNKDFSSDYSVEGALSGSLNSLTGTTYETETEVADGVLDVVINKGRKSWGGYISGMDVIPIATPPVTEPPDEDPRIETELFPDKTMLTASPVNCGDGTLICALYTGGRLIKCFAEEYSGDDMDFDVVSGADKAVVMLWDSFDKMTPVCEACKTNPLGQ